jgi:hypothetical protein
MLREPRTALASFASILLAMVSSCAPAQVRADDDEPIRWEYKVVAVSELVGDAAFTFEGASGLALMTLAFAGGKEEKARKELEGVEGGKELLSEIDALKERAKQSEAAFLSGLNDLGAEGWEVVWMAPGQSVLLKRRVE